MKYPRQSRERGVRGGAYGTKGEVIRCKDESDLVCILPWGPIIYVQCYEVPLLVQCYSGNEADEAAEADDDRSGA